MAVDRPMPNDTYDDRGLVSESVGRITPLRKQKVKRGGASAPLPKDSRTVINKRNRRNGSTAQTQWARMIHGRNVGVLGGEDVNDGFRLFEVKARKLPQWLRDAYAQVSRNNGHELRYVVVRHPGKSGQAVEWWVLQPASQFIDTNGLGLVVLKR